MINYLSRRCHRASAHSQLTKTVAVAYDFSLVRLSDVCGSQLVQARSARGALASQHALRLLVSARCEQ